MATVIDVGPTLKLVSGLQNLGNALARRLSTDTLFYDPGYKCVDVRRWLSAGFKAPAIAELHALVEAAIEDDDRVLSADVKLDANIPAQQMKITIAASTAAGPFTLILGVSRLTVELLELREAA